MVEQSTAAARSLASEASQLLKLVSRFNISRTENAKRRPVATPRPMVAVPKATRKPAVKALPVSNGNTALKAEPADEDWKIGRTNVSTTVTKAQFVCLL